LIESNFEPRVIAVAKTRVTSANSPTRFTYISSASENAKLRTEL